MADAAAFVVTATTYGKEPTRLNAEVTHFDRRARMGRAARIAGPLALGALATLPIIGLHFFTVPGFLIAAVVFGRKRWLETYKVHSLVGPCPAHGEEVEFPPPTGFPVTTRCPSCSEFVKLEALGAPAEPALARTENG